MAFEKNISWDEFKKSGANCCRNVSYRSEDLSFDDEFIMNKFELEPVDIAILYNKLGPIIKPEKKRDLIRLLEERLELLASFESNTKMIAGYNKYIFNVLKDVSPTIITEEKKQIEAIISGLGISKVTDEAKNNAIKDYGDEYGQQMIYNAEHKVNIVGFKSCTVEIKLQKPFNNRMTNIKELIILTMFWIPRKGLIPKTSGHDFFEFCSYILTTNENKVTSNAMFDKFKNYIILDIYP